MTRSVVITGVGAVTPLGVGARTLHERWTAGVSGIEDGYGRASEFEPKEHLSVKEVRRSDRFTQLALAAAQEALEDAGWDGEKPYDPERTASVIGTGIGGIGTLEREHIVLQQEGAERISPLSIPLLMANAASGVIAMKHDLRGQSFGTVSACAAGAHAIGMAERLIRYGDADVVVTGGSEAAITQQSYAGFCSMKALSTRNDSPETASRPFDLDRDGFVMGEGAGVLVIEELEYARRRGAKILAEIAGYGMSSDAYHISSPSEDGDGPIRVMRATLADAGVAPKDVSYINAHGTSTPAGDRIESLAIKTVFGEHAKKIPVSSTKSAMGHLLGAAGGVETAVCILAVGRDIVPPTINLNKPDPDCDLDFVPNKARPVEVRWALNNSFGFGGTNASILVGKYKD